MDRSFSEDRELDEINVFSEPCDLVEYEMPIKKKSAHLPLSRVLQNFADDATGDVTMADLRDELGDRSFAALLSVFSAVNLIPVLPPLSTLIFGVPPLIIAVQMLLGHERLWLPGKILNWSFSAEKFRPLISAVTPRLSKLEQFIKPRYWPFALKNGERLVGATSILLSILVILPIPGANWIPAFAMVLMGLSLSERDGVLYAIGSAIGIVFLGFFVTVMGLAASHMGEAFNATWHFISSFF